MDGDGTQNGYDLHLTESVTNIVNIPVIASGAVSYTHLTLPTKRIV